MKRIDVAVVGGGPAGLIAAFEIARRGAQVEVFEEHPRIGEPKHCAGLVSIEGLKRLGIEPDERFVQNIVSGGVLYSPKGASIEIESSTPRAYVIDRPAFDRHLSSRAEEKGVKINLRCRVKAFPREGHARVVQTSKERVYANLIVDARGAGASPPIREDAYSSRAMRLRGVNTEVEGCPVEESKVEVWFGRDLAPGFFAWVIPLGGGRARCGLACDGSDPVERLERFVFKRFGLSRPLKIWGGTILLSGPSRKTYDEGLIIAGDAAGQTKPTTGGGVILGGLCAIEAGKIAAEAAGARDSSSRFLARYQSAWREKYGGDFRKMSAIRSFANNLSDDQLEQIFRIIKDENLEELLKGFVDEGDMDLQGKVITSILMNPNMLKMLLKVSGRTLYSRLKRMLNL